MDDDKLRLAWRGDQPWDMRRGQRVAGYTANAAPLLRLRVETDQLTGCWDWRLSNGASVLAGGQCDGAEDGKRQAERAALDHLSKAVAAFGLAVAEPAPRGVASPPPPPEAWAEIKAMIKGHSLSHPGAEIPPALHRRMGDQIISELISERGDPLADLRPARPEGIGLLGVAWDEGARPESSLARRCLLQTPPPERPLFESSQRGGKSAHAREVAERMARQGMHVLITGPGGDEVIPPAEPCGDPNCTICYTEQKESPDALQP